MSKWYSPSQYETTCDLRCEEYDYTHFTFIFTAFVMCTLFNECVPCGAVVRLACRAVPFSLLAPYPALTMRCG